MDMILDRPSVTADVREARAALVRRAADLVPLLRENAQRTEDQRNVPEEVISAVQKAGLLKIMQPKRYGGLETDFRTKLEVTRELARGDGSTAWTVSLLNSCHFFAGYWNEQAQDDVWGENPDSLIAGVLAPTGTAQPLEGGWRVNGSWSWCTGCQHAQWGLFGIPILGDQGELVDQGLILIPMSELTIKDTWFVTGMKGTGSNTVVAEDVFVPSHRFVSVFKLLSGATDNPYEAESMYRTTFMAGGTVLLCGPHLGLAKAALDFVIEKAAKRDISYTFYDKQSEAPTVQLAIAKAASLIGTAELLAYRAAAQVDEAAEQNEFLSYVERARIRMDTAQSIVNAREAIRELISAHGASSFSDQSPLQRIWRDSEVASRHAVANPAIASEVYGRALLGYTEGVTPLI